MDEVPLQFSKKVLIATHTVGDAPPIRVDLHHTIDFTDLCGANLVTRW